MTAVMKLSELCDSTAYSGIDPTLTGISGDSRTVQPGELFLATAQAPSEHIQQALHRGAAAVVWDASVNEKLEFPVGVPGFAVTNLARKQGQLASQFFGRPSHHLQVVGVTGTNGKTSVCHFLAQVLDSCAVIGTLGNGFLRSLEVATHTTPDAVQLQGRLAQLREKGARQVAVEVSSHALVQHRVEGVRFACAVFTNLSRDHLDYHQDMASYGEAKATLFGQPDLQSAVINLDDAFGQALLATLSSELPITTFGTSDAAGTPSLQGVDITLDARGIAFTLCSDEDQGRVELPILGEFNVSNLLAVMATLLRLQVPFGDALARLQQVTPVPGRMERLVRPDGSGPTVVLDYAHNPHGLESVLLAVRQHMVGSDKGSLICLFGCGGERDQGKRPLMGALAERLADRVVLTNDNPRGEDSEEILRQIGCGISSAGAVQRIPDRATAIAETIAAAGPEDWVLIAGKGDEREQVLAKQRLPFSDRVEIRRALEQCA